MEEEGKKLTEEFLLHLEFDFTRDDDNRSPSRRRWIYFSNLQEADASTQEPQREESLQGTNFGREVASEGGRVEEIRLLGQVQR
jgi:hypothetical protein